MSVCLLTDIRCIDAGGTVLARQLTEDKVRQAAFSILKSSTVCSIATVTPESRSHINTAYFSYTLEYELFFLSNLNSVHCQNLTRNSSMALAVVPSSPVWGAASLGLQLFGTAAEVSGAFAETANRSYEMRFPDFIKWREMVGKADSGGPFRLYRFAVGSFKLLDEMSFGDSVWVCVSILRK